MDFKFTAEQEAIYRTALNFGKTVKARADRQSFDIWKEAGEFGLLGLCIPNEFGGMGLGAVETALGLEAFSKGSQDAGLAFSIAAHLLACAMPIAEVASAEMKKDFLPKLCSGEKIGANAITEPEAGSDTSLLKTTAEKRGNYYVLNGIKVFITNGPIADAFIVYATTNRAHGYKGVSAFLVEKGTPGLRVGKDLEKFGPTHSPFGELHFTDCEIPEQNRIGNEGVGSDIFKLAMNWERACLFAIYIGQMESELEQAVEHAKNRRQFGKAIGRNQAISHQIADMKIRLEAARWLLYHACWKLDQKMDATLEISMAKVAISEAAVESSLRCIHIFGGSAILMESHISNGLRNAVPSTLFSGTSEIQRDLIARKLGL